LETTTKIFHHQSFKSASVLKKLLHISCGLFVLFFNGFSQEKDVAPAQKTMPQITRCATTQRVEMLFRAFPEKKLLAERLAKELPANNSLRAPKRLAAIVNIPVVFHIVLSNPYVITDEAVKSQIDVMNTDFAGLNADSTNIPAAFQAVRGHSLIRFVLAKRTPSGQLTNGIDRVSSSTTGDPNNIVDSIKRKSLGGADAWDPNLYLNIWVGNISGGQGVLGYTQIPGSGSPLDDGVFCNILGFGISSCNAGSYNKGRTIVHELGHYFGINHIWGDDETEPNECSGDDFRALTDDGSTYTLPLTLYNPHGKGNTSDDIGDTPNQSVASNDCGSGIVTDQCTPTSPGIMYENFMDYTMDNCYSLFTKKQVARMEYVLQNYRSSLITSTGATAPAGAPAVDAAPILSVNPGGIETTGCTSIFHPSTLTCAGNIVPKVLIKNNGLNTITSITVGYVLNGGTPVTVSVNTNLVSGATQMISFPSIAVPIGNYIFKFFTKNANGSATDNVPANDTLTATLSVPNPVPLPLSESFENSVCPPTGWAIINPGNDVTWTKTTPGKNSAHSMFINNFDDNPVGQTDEIRTPKLTLASADPVVITFDLAHKNYPDAAYNDSLQVLVSNDCGATFKIYFNKAGAALATAGSSDQAYINPAASDWQTQKITLTGSVLSAGNIIVAFKSTSDWGNNIFIDNINIKQETSRDISVIAVNPPAAIDCAEPTIPTATVKNVGFSTITSFKVSYKIDNGALSETTVSGVSLAADQEINVPLNTFTPATGQHKITVFTTAPTSSLGTGDQSPLNDTLTKPFFVVGKVNPPVTEDFENAVFPPPTWVVGNDDGGITWERTTQTAKTGAASMVIKNFNNSSTGTTDKFVSSVITGTTDFDTVFVSFDYAYALGNSTSLSDTLELQVTTDCGQTFTTVWKNWGSGLQTNTDQSAGGFVPDANDWKNVSLNLFKQVGTNDFQLYFVDKGNKQNNLYIDNINLYGITVPARLKQQGYLIYPNPFHQQFFIRNYEVPVTLQSAHIYNSVGQLVWSKTYNGNAYTQMPVDLGNLQSGVYFLKLQYSDKSVVQKIVKN
jgi:hypothetical protein